MGRFNFDALFTGDPTSQALKVHDFLHGLELVVEEKRRFFAHCIVYGQNVGGALDALAEVTEAQAAFVKDERLIPLVKFIKEDTVRRQKKSIADALSEILG